ncbi:MAG: hypothetical protein HY684_00180 [Chloroflexi bacterium]|nr:hypothetical protein [Chloroflexota bacterium]
MVGPSDIVEDMVIDGIKVAAGAAITYVLPKVQRHRAQIGGALMLATFTGALWTELPDNVKPSAPLSDPLASSIQLTTGWSSMVGMPTT